MTRMRLRPEVRELVTWAESIGWTLQRYSGGGHLILIHNSGEKVTLPSTPSDPRSLTNTRADIRRISGIKSESGPAARYRHKPRREGFDMDAAIREARLRRAQEEAERRRRALLQVQIDEAHHALSHVNPRRDPDLARELAARIVDLETQLNSP